MGVILNAINFGLGFNIGASTPIDSRMRVQYLSDLTSSFNSSQFPSYDGMIVSVLANGHVYRLNGTGSNKMENWILMVDQVILSQSMGSASAEINKKLDSASFNSWTGSNTSRFQGTASYALSSSWAKNVHWSDISERPSTYSSSLSASYALNGPFLHISGGTVTGDVTFQSRFIQGNGTSVYGSGSHAEGYKTYALGHYSHAEGSQTTGSGQYSHAEGAGTFASGNQSHAEGQDTVAKGIGSHAEGQYTLASGQYSHAEGTASKSEGFATHAEGDHTIATGQAQTVVGRYNSPSEDYAFIVGGGSGSYVSQSGGFVEEVRKNLLGVGWDGNIDLLPGSVIHGTSSFALNVESAFETSRLKSGSCSITVDTKNQEIIFKVD